MVNALSLLLMSTTYFGIFVGIRGVIVGVIDVTDVYLRCCVIVVVVICYTVFFLSLLVLLFYVLCCGC